MMVSPLSNNGYERRQCNGRSTKNRNLQTK